MSKKIFIFKDEEYTINELFKLNKEKRKYYMEGNVMDNIDGCIFDISEILTMKEKYYGELNDLVLKLQDGNSSSLVWALKKKEKKKEIDRLNLKYNNNTIKLEELEWLLKLEKGIDLKKNYYVVFPSNGTFYKKNNSFKYPKSLSGLDIGRLTLLLDFMTYKNEIKRTPRENASYPTITDLMNYMRIETKRTLNRVLKVLKGVDIIDYDKKEGKIIIYINPLFGNRNLKIHPEIYKRFKTQLDSVLDEKEIRYLELLTFNDKESGTLVLKNDQGR